MLETRMRKTILGLLATFAIQATAQGGPPMVTDDPGTPGDGHWEINIASLYAATTSQNVLQAPYFDINYGWGDHIQLKVETGWVNAWYHPAADGAGTGTAVGGVKYRFLDEDTSGVSVSTYPQIQFHHYFSSHDPQIASPGTQYILPVELSKSFGAWEINPEVGYIYSTEGSNELLYGVVLAYEKAKPLEPMIEVHFNQALDGSGTVTLLNVGARYALNPKTNLMAAAGHTVTTTRDAEPELDLYLGIQLER